jgi:hypothetical protein
VTDHQTDVLVAQALDDLEAGHVDVPAALRLAATIAYRQGRRDAEHARSAHLPAPRPGQAYEHDGCGVH